MGFKLGLLGPMTMVSWAMEFWYRTRVPVPRWEKCPQLMFSLMGMTEGLQSQMDTGFFFSVFQIIDSLKGLQVKKVALGDGFSVFLTSKGQVFTCGQAQLAGLPESLASLFKPTQVRFRVLEERNSFGVFAKSHFQEKAKQTFLLLLCLIMYSYLLRSRPWKTFSS